MSNYERLTITLNKEIAQKLRKIQAKMIENSSTTVSFSRVCNETLEKGLKKK